MTALDFFMNSLNAESYAGDFWKAYKKAKIMEEEQMRKAYSEGFKRCSYIKLLSEGNVLSEGERIPEDFDTYYENNYGEE